MEALEHSTFDGSTAAVVICAAECRGARPSASSPMPRPTVADALRNHGTAYLQNCGHEVDAYQRRVLKRLMQCQTPALGGHGWQCEACGHRHFAYNSCNNRHCPTCYRAPQLRWLEKMRAWQLPVRYFHVVFTVPHQLCPLILANRGPLFSLLMQCAAQTLLTLAAEQLGAEPGVAVTPHSWGQLTLPHPHGHCIVTPGGLSLDGTRWVDASEQLLAQEDLARRFRQLYLRGILRLYRRGKLTLPDSMRHITSREQLRLWLVPLARRTWVVDCQGPPVDCKDSEAVLKYLARYVAGTAIHNGRMVSDDGQHVTYTAKDYRNGTRDEVTITGEEFVRRFCYHIFPKGFHRSRSYGLFAARNRKEKLPRCRQLLGVDESEKAALPEAEPDASCEPREVEEDELEEAEEENQIRKRCPRCLLWAMVWMGRFTVAEIDWIERRQAQLGKLLVSVVSTLDTEQAERLAERQAEFERQQNELCLLLLRLPLPDS